MRDHRSDHSDRPDEAKDAWGDDPRGLDSGLARERLVELMGREVPEPTAQQRVEHLDRVRERDATRHSPDFDVRRADELERAEKRTNPEGFARKHVNEGWTPVDEQDLKQGLARRPDAQD